MGEKRFGVMIDASRNAVMNMKTLKGFTTEIKKFGYNSVMLYTEDTYEVEGEPYFGYMRGKYTANEIKEYDAFCKSEGIELIPCIQTLAHLNAIFRWRRYWGYNDTGDILMCENEKVYSLIEHMFDTLEKNFSSRIVHIGMDEADLVGFGWYRHVHGVKDQYEVLKTHLEKVTEIAKKHGFTPIMWSDMFFRIANGGEYCIKENSNFDVNKVKDKIPKEMGLVYWDYYQDKEKTFNDMIVAHKQLSDNVWFAGGAWTWEGFAPQNSLTFKTMVPAMKACKKNGIDNVIITLWGDNGGECSKFSALSALFYVKRIYDGETDDVKIKEEFYKLTGESFDYMTALDLPNLICGNKDSQVNPSKYALYNDLFNGFMDTAMPSGGEIEYANHAITLHDMGKNSKYAYVFETLSLLCDLLSDKYSLGKEIRKNYEEKNIKGLKSCIKKIKIVQKKTERFYAAFRKQWEIENKPNGFDVQDLRIGGLERRLKTCEERLKEYVSGKIEEIQELEEKTLDFFGNENDITEKLVTLNAWALTATANVI